MPRKLGPGPGTEEELEVGAGMGTRGTWAAGGPGAAGTTEAVAPRGAGAGRTKSRLGRAAEEQIRCVEWVEMVIGAKKGMAVEAVAATAAKDLMVGVPAKEAEMIEVQASEEGALAGRGVGQGGWLGRGAGRGPDWWGRGGGWGAVDGEGVAALAEAVAVGATVAMAETAARGVAALVEAEKAWVEGEGG